MVTRTNHVIALTGFTLQGGPWHLGNFCYMFLPNNGEDKKSPIIRAQGSWHCAKGKSGPGYCITLIKKLDEGVR